MSDQAASGPPTPESPIRRLQGDPEPPIRRLQGDPESPIRRLQGDPESPIRRLQGDPESPIRRLQGDPESPWEEIFGFSRVVDTGSLVVITGTTSVDPSGFVVGDTPYEQAAVIFRKLIHELSRVGLGAHSVIQTRMFVTDISRGDEVGRAHAEVFGAVRPTATMVEVSGLIDPRMLVEVELMAVRLTA